MSATATLDLTIARTPYALARVIATCAACWVEVSELDYAGGRVALRIEGRPAQLERAAARLGRLVDVHECAPSDSLRA
jgi:hypothetical protein